MDSAAHHDSDTEDKVDTFKRSDASGELRLIPDTELSPAEIHRIPLDQLEERRLRALGK